MREIIKKLAEGIWVDEYCAGCGALRCENIHRPDCLVMQANEALRLNTDGSRKVEFVGMDNIIAGAIESFRDTLIDRFNVHIPKGATTAFFIANGVDWSNPDPKWFVGDHVDRALKVITNALKPNPLYDELVFIPMPTGDCNMSPKMKAEEDIRKSFETIQKAVLNDQDYARGWHLNISTTAYRCGTDSDTANKIAVLFMKEVFEVDTSCLCKESYMKFDPETGIKIPNTTPELYRETHTGVAWLFNPWSGDKRDSRDIGSDVFGLLMVAPGESIKAMKE